MKDTGGAAFPFVYDDKNQRHIHGGMTLRDYFAAKAIALAMAEYRMVTCKPGEPMGEDWGVQYGLSVVASKAYEMADAMLAERGQQ